MVVLAPGPSAGGQPLPTGTVTFVFTDIEGSTQLVQRVGDEHFRTVIEDHDRLLRAAFESTGGVVVRTEGDSLFVAFSDAGAAVDGAVAGQRALASHDWGDAPLRVRMGLHTGEGRLGGDNYIGFDVHRAARISAVAWGGQVVASAATVEAAAPVEGVAFDDLGLHRLKDLSAPEHIHQVVAEGLEREFPALRSLDTSPHRLPNPVSSFIGRETEVSEVAALVSSGRRLVTLLGPGGTGKTRLAITVAHEVADRFPDGAVFVPLAPLADPDLVPAAIVEAMGVQRPGGGVDPIDHLVGVTTGRRMLLVLDNFEHLLEASPLVGDLLNASAELQVLATSRAPLRLDGEDEVQVEPLPLPDGSRPAVDTASVALFLDRAGLPRSDEPLSPPEVAAITQLVRRLDGLPLAIEIAAARARTIPVEAILRNLDAALRTDRRDLPARQRTIESTIRWSYDLLDPGGRDLFERLGAFSGGAGLEQIEAIATDLPDVWGDLEHLVDHSLLLRTDVRGVPRFRMLETIRAFADERLRERDDIWDVYRRHCEIYVDLVSEAATHLKSAARSSWLDRLEDDHGNILSSLERSTEMQVPEIALPLVSGAWRFWQMRGYLHGADARIAAALAVPGGTDEQRTNALRAAGGIAYWRGEIVAQADHYRAAVAMARRTGDPQLLADTLYDASYSIAAQEGFDVGKQILDEAEELYLSVGDLQGLGHIAWIWGSMWQLVDDFEAAAMACRRSIGYFDPVEDSFDLGWAEFMLADNLIRLGRNDEAGVHLREGLDSFIEAGDLSAMPLFFVMFARLAIDAGDWARGMKLVAAASRISKESGAGMIESDPRMMDRYPHQPIESLPAEVRAAHAEGLTMTLDEALAFVTPRVEA